MTAVGADGDATRELVSGGGAGRRGVSVAGLTRLWTWANAGDTDVRVLPGRAQSKRTAILNHHDYHINWDHPRAVHELGV